MDARNFLKVQNFKLKVENFEFEDVKFMTSTQKSKMGTNLQMGFFPYVVYNFLKLLIGSPRNHF